MLEFELIRLDFYFISVHRGNLNTNGEYTARLILDRSSESVLRPALGLFPALRVSRGRWGNLAGNAAGPLAGPAGRSFTIRGDPPNTRTKASRPVQLLIRRRLLDVIDRDVHRGNLGGDEFEAKRS